MHQHLTLPEGDSMTPQCHDFARERNRRRIAFRHCRESRLPFLLYAVLIVAVILPVLSFMV